MNNRIAIGTVKFGMRYGIDEESGPIDQEEISQIFDHGEAAGLNTLDTAIDYGEGESTLGKVGIDRWRIITKLPAVPEYCKDVETWIFNSIKDSIRRLKVDSIQGLLLHRPEQLLGPQADDIYDGLCAIKKSGLVKKLGISIYEPRELELIWPRYQFDIVQSPLNILDRRLVTSGWLNKLSELGVEVHVRSIFLQGLLLSSSSMPQKFKRWQCLWDEWSRYLTKESMTPLQACMGYVMSHSKINMIVIGINNLIHLKEVIAVYKKNILKFPNHIVSNDTCLINPSKWKNI